MKNDTPKTLACFRNGKWHIDELSNLSAKLERELLEMKASINNRELQDQMNELNQELIHSQTIDNP